MKTKLTETGQRNYDLLTSSTFYVIDTEYTATGDGSKKNSIISLAVIPIRQGRIDVGDCLYCEMNPGVAISAESSRIHGFTDQKVKGKRRFDYYAPKILEKLSDPNAVLVCHTSVDVHALRAELSRLDEHGANGEDLKVGLADLPDLKIIDSSRLGKSLAYPGIGSRSFIGLAELCKVTGVVNKGAHNAKSDAIATAEAFLELLAFAAQESAVSDLGEVLRKHTAKTTHSPSPEIIFRGHKAVEPDLPPEHIARHSLQLDHVATQEELTAWLGLAKECAELRCPLLVDDVILAGELNALALLDPFVALLPTLLAPGQVGTLVGALCELVEPRERAGGTALRGTRATRWWREDGQKIALYPRCGLDFSEMCPACRRGEICPIDRIHQLVAQNALFGEGKSFTQESFRDLFREGYATRIRKWKPIYPEYAAYAAWLAINRGWQEHSQQLTQNNLEISIELGLHKLEPRLALMVADQWVSSGQLTEALGLCDEVLLRRNTDPAFDELEEWAKLTRVETSQRSRTATGRTVTHPRLARPAGRVNPNPYSVS